MGVADAPSEANPRIPEILFCIYQGMFAAITPALVIGSTAERGRFLPTILFMFLWTTLVYDFICYWVWGPNGWYFVLGGELHNHLHYRNQLEYLNMLNFSYLLFNVFFVLKFVFAILKMLSKF